MKQSDETMWRLLRNNYVEGGLAGLYRGLTPSVVRTFPATASLFVVYEYLDQYLTQQADHALGRS